MVWGGGEEGEGGRDEGAPACPGPAFLECSPHSPHEVGLHDWQHPYRSTHSKHLRPTSPSPLPLHDNFQNTEPQGGKSLLPIS